MQICMRVWPAAFQFHFMALAINVIDRHGPSNKIHHQLQPKKTKANAILALYIAAKDALPALHY